MAQAIPFLVRTVPQGLRAVSTALSGPRAVVGAVGGDTALRVYDHFSRPGGDGPRHQPRPRTSGTNPFFSSFRNYPARPASRSRSSMPFRRRKGRPVGLYRRRRRRWRTRRTRIASVPRYLRYHRTYGMEMRNFTLRTPLALVKSPDASPPYTVHGFDIQVSPWSVIEAGSHASPGPVYIGYPGGSSPQGAPLIDQQCYPLGIQQLRGIYDRIKVNRVTILWYPCSYNATPSVAADDRGHLQVPLMAYWDSDCDVYNTAGRCHPADIAQVQRLGTMQIFNLGRPFRYDVRRPVYTNPTGQSGFFNLDQIPTGASGRLGIRTVADDTLPAGRHYGYLRVEWNVTLKGRD